MWDPLTNKHSLQRNLARDCQVAHTEDETMLNLNQNKSDSIRRYANTHVYTDADAIQVVLHETPIVSVNVTRDENTFNVRLDSGGWRTPTTKKRMNELASELGLSYQVYQKDGEWFVCANNQPYHKQPSVLFHDGIRLMVRRTG